LENAALREAAFGNSAEAKQVAAEGVKLYPASQAMEVESALGYALTSDSTLGALAQDLSAHYPDRRYVQIN
jgi:hypothetical protein